MVRSTSTLNPYTNPEAALARRNLVLDTLIQNFPTRLTTPEGRRRRSASWPGPRRCRRAASGRATARSSATMRCPSGRAGITKDDLARNGYLIRATLDPKVQDSVKQAIDEIASPDLDGIASV